SWRRRSGEDRLPLFDAGLEALLVQALKLPEPSGEAAAPAPGPVASPPTDPAAKRKL
ncbi:MAG: hypothetical protein H0V89_07315, partial [Deltaproteobacteria bacterium]|nr:hypothetical protein [Deltaproteobacteria bacterium]